MKNNTVLIIIITLIIGGAAGFFAGSKYRQNKTLNGFNNAGDFNGGGFGRGQGTGRLNGSQGAFRPTTGKITAGDDNSITIQLPDGSSKIILLSDKTRINKAEKATKNDLSQGTEVAVFGTVNPDGSITAQTVQLNPQLIGGTRRQPNQSAKSADAAEIVITGSNYKFTPNKISVKKGQKTRILFKSADGPHDFRLDELNLATAVIQGGQEDFVEFTPDKTGTYQFYCSVDGHRQMGMVGTLTVE